MKFVQKAPLFFLIGLFALLFSLSDVLTPLREFSETENRYLADFPSVTARTVLDGDFSEDYETYISDQFLFRDVWTGIKSVSESALLKTENNGVIYGKNGYLFSKFFRFDSAVLQNNLESIDTFAAAMKAPVAFMAVPSKYHPLIDYLPSGVPLVDQNYYITKINNYLSANADIVNARDILSVNASRYIYYRTDHHWTAYGAWLAYSQFAPAAGLTPFPYEANSLLSADGFLGTNYSKSHPPVTEPDTINYFDFDIRKLTADGKEYDSLYNSEQFKKRDKYAAFIQGNNGLTVIESEYGTEKKDSLLIIKDSFANSLIPLLTQHYNTIYAIDPRFYNNQLGYKQYADMEFDQILILYSFETLAAQSNINYLSLDFET